MARSTVIWTRMNGGFSGKSDRAKALILKKTGNQLKKSLTIQLEGDTPNSHAIGFWYMSIC